MKNKCILLFSLCFVLIFSSCVPKKGNDPFSALREASEIRATVSEIVFTMQKTEDGCIFTFEEPKLFCPLRVTVTNENIRAIYDGLDSDLPKTCLGSILPFYDAVRAFSDSTEEFSAGTESIFRLTLDGKEFLLYHNTEDALPDRIDAGGNQYTILSAK